MKDPDNCPKCGCTWFKHLPRHDHNIYWAQCKACFHTYRYKSIGEKDEIRQQLREWIERIQSMDDYQAQLNKKLNEDFQELKRLHCDIRRAFERFPN